MGVGANKQKYTVQRIKKLSKEYRKITEKLEKLTEEK
jgi:hypothetical protein